MLIAGVLIALTLLWAVAVAPAWRTLSRASQEHARLDAQLEQMLTLQQQARTLKALPRIDRQQAIRALESSVQSSFGAQAQTQRSAGDAINVSLRGVPAEQLATWLTQARVNARAVPREMRLTRSAAPPPARATTAPRSSYSDNRSTPSGSAAVASTRRRPPNSNPNLPRTPEAEGAQPNLDDTGPGATAGASTPSPVPAAAAQLSPPGTPPPTQWDGTVVLTLPNS